MAMLGKLFKPRWQHRDAEVRAQAVATLDPRQDQETLSKLARDDDSARVRAAAVATLLDLHLLDRLIETDTDAGVRDAASDRFVALLAGTVEGAPPVDTRLRLIQHTGNARVLLHVARHSPDQGCREAALAAIDDPESLYQLALEGADAALRLAAAERLQDATLLRQLGREGRDKKVVRLARDRVKALQAQDADARRHGEQLDALIEALEQLAQHSTDPLFEGRLQQLEQRWRGLAEHADDARAARVESALGQCHAHLREQQDAAARQQAQQSAAHERRAALDTLRALYRDLSAETWDQQLGELRSAVATQERRWQAAGELLEADDESDLTFHSRLSEWRRLIALAESALDAEDDEQRRDLAAQWPDKVPAPSALASARPPQPQEQQATKPSSPPDRSNSHSEHRGLVVALRRELQQGNLKHANRLWHKAEAVLAEHSDPWLHQQLERLTPRREELRDWHAFAAQPKKEQLCERMEALAETEMDAEERASAVQALHEEWRALMSSDQDQDQALWDRFKAASDRAYEPCRAHFAELDAQRAENLQRRQALCQQLADFVAAQDWQNADWQAVWEIRRQAPQEWKSHAPVRFTDAREAQKRFSALLSEIDERLEEAWRQAEQPRQALLDRAAALAEGVAAAHASEQGTDVRGAAREAQELQKQWRAAPWLPPARHRPFQKRFRRTMDTIFAARQADSEQKQAQRAEAADQAQTVLERAAQQTARPLPEQDGATLAALAEELQALDSASLGRGLQQQLQRLQEQLRALRKDLPRWQRWQAACERIAGAPTGDERGEDRALAAALEALAGVDSPEHAREERMAWQLERLPKAMKSSGFTPLEEALALVDERPVGTALAPDLAARMATALTALEPRP
jgi:DNA repair protein SbcC/Rad50